MCAYVFACVHLCEWVCVLRVCVCVCMRECVSAQVQALGSGDRGVRTELTSGKGLLHLAGPKVESLLHY